LLVSSKRIFKGPLGCELIFLLLTVPKWTCARSNYASTCLLILQNHFLPSGPSKMRIHRGRERYVSTRRLTKILIFCFQVVPRCNLSEFEKAMFQAVDFPWEPIFCLLSGPKCDLIEVEKTIFQGPSGLWTYFVPSGRP
jgi:hypothetical protein